jgi:hypothetical protein
MQKTTCTFSHGWNFRLKGGIKKFLFSEIILKIISLTKKGKVSFAADRKG